jgi:hypothetical protein
MSLLVVASDFAAALSEIPSRDPIGDDAPSSAPIPEPPPSTNRPPPQIIINPLLGRALAEATSRVPPSIIVPPV